MSTFGSTTEDLDGVPKDYDRGPPEEDRKTEAELRGAMQDINKAKLSMGEIATVQGIAAEMKVLRSLVDDISEQNNKLVALYSTMRGEFDQYKQQRVIELQSWLANGGSTTPEDIDGADT
jgi:hypothetical protein